MMYFLVPLLAMAAAALAIVGLYQFNQKSPVEVRMADYNTAAHPVVKPSYFELRLRPLGTKLATWFPELKRWITPADIEDRLAYAGDPLGLNGNQFFGLQLLAAFVFAFYGILIGFLWTRLTGLILGGLLFGGFGLYFPIMWLNSRAKERQRAITIAVPDAIDLIATGMEAGLGFDITLHHVVPRLRGPLAEELGRFVRELRMGIPREECFRRLMARNSSEELRTVVGAMLQAHLLGAPLSQTLQDQAEGMRARRLQRAKEAGAKASPKISLVTTMLIAPSVMCLFISVIGFKLLQTVGPLLQQFSR